MAAAIASTLAFAEGQVAHAQVALDRHLEVGGLYGYTYEVRRYGDFVGPTFKGFTLRPIVQRLGRVALGALGTFERYDGSDERLTAVGPLVRVASGLSGLEAETAPLLGRWYDPNEIAKHSNNAYGVTVGIAAPIHDFTVGASWRFVRATGFEQIPPSGFGPGSVDRYINGFALELRYSLR